VEFLRRAKPAAKAETAAADMHDALDAMNVTSESLTEDELASNWRREWKASEAGNET
jgi:hypothetical protein